jgi:hypothetical protein
MKYPFFLIGMMLHLLSAAVLATGTEAGPGSLSASVQNDSTSFKQVWQNVNARLEANKARKIEEGRVIISPAVMPGYNPEMKFMLTGGGIVSWTNNRHNPELPRSNMAVGFALSTTGAMVINIRPVTFWANDRFRLNMGLWHKNMPDNYWGVGYQNAFQTPESDTVTAFRRKWYKVKTDALLRIRGGLFAGLTFDLNHTHGTEEAAGVLSDPWYAYYNDRPFNSGMGVMARMDSRDITVNAWKGIFLDAQILFYGPWLGGDNRYQMAVLDYRQYRRIRQQDGRILAWQLYSRMGFGEVPYGEMSQLGSPFGLRGYTWGQYRDRSMFYLMAEYRHTFRRGDGRLSRHGVVTWAGSGWVYDLQEPEFSLPEGPNRLLPNLGIGYRLEVQPRLNMRLDFGLGRNTTGFYFNVVEAF